MDTDLVCGPAAAIRCIRDQDERAPKETNWYDDVWCEGAALIDQTRQVLLFFSTHFVDFAHRAAVLTVLRHTWPGWDVRWAYDGAGDLAAYVGLDRRILRGSGMLFEPTGSDDDVVDQLITVRRVPGSVDAYGIALPFDDCLELGPEVVDLLPTDALVTACQLPRAGMHIDLVDRELGLWTTDAWCGLKERVDWPGWRTVWWQDRYREQLDRCAVTVPDWTPADGLKTLSERLAVAPPWANTHVGPEELGRAEAVVAGLVVSAER